MSPQPDFENAIEAFLTDPSNAAFLAALGGGLLTSAVHLSSAQILAMHTTPPALTPAPGASQIIVPVSILFIYNFVTTPYTLPFNPTLYVSTTSDIGGSEWGGNGGSWFKFQKNLLSFPFSAMSAVPFTLDITVGADDKELSTSVGEELRLFTGGEASDYQLTDGDGTLDVITKYYLLDYPIVPT